jgi:hypothetical protein
VRTARSSFDIPLACFLQELEARMGIEPMYTVLQTLRLVNDTSMNH